MSYRTKISVIEIFDCSCPGVSMLWYHSCYGFCRQGRHAGTSATFGSDAQVMEPTLTDVVGDSYSVLC